MVLVVKKLNPRIGNEKLRVKYGHGLKVWAMYVTYIGRWMLKGMNNCVENLVCLLRLN